MTESRQTILHLVPFAEWHMQHPAVPFAPASLEAEGFVHCTGDLDGLLTVANRFYRDQPGDFLAVELTVDGLAAEVRWEAPAHPTGEAATPDEPRFPHVYGPLGRAAVTGVHRAQRTDDGTFLGWEPA